MGEAANIALNAIGKQDTHLLSKDPKDSLFKYDYKRHSQYTKNYVIRNVYNESNDILDDVTMKVEYNPQNMGHLLGNFWIKIPVTPRAGESFITNDRTYSSVSEYLFLDGLGFNLIHSVNMYVDEILVETITNDWIAINHSLYASRTQQVANNLSMGAGNSIISTESNFPSFLDQLQSSSDIMVHIPFFFSQVLNDADADNKGRRPLFPVCAVHKQKIIFEIRFQPKSFWKIRFDSPIIDTVHEFQIITEEYIIPGEELIFFRNNNWRQTVVLTTKENSKETDTLSQDEIKQKLSPRGAVKTIHWFVRRSIHENLDRSILNENLLRSYRHETGLVPEDVNSRTHNIFSDAHLIKKSRLYMKGQSYPLIRNNESQLHHVLQAHKHKLNIQQNRIHVLTQSFSLFPKKYQSTGYFNFSSILSDNTTLQVEINRDKNINGEYYDPFAGRTLYVLHIYYTSYFTLHFDGGFLLKIE